MYPTAASEALQAYNEATKQYPPLTREEELQLARRGDQRSRNLLVAHHLRFAVGMALRYRGYGLPIEDLIGEGNIGLMEASKRFDPERGLRFMTYATYWIRAFLLDYVIKSWSIVKVSNSPLHTKLFFKLQKERARMLAETGESTPAQLAAKMGVKERAVVDMLGRLNGRDGSLDAPVYRNNDPLDSQQLTQADALVDDRPGPEADVVDADDLAHVRERIDCAMGALTPRERAIVERRLMADEPEKLAELGAEMGLSRERVRQIEVYIKGKMKPFLVEDEDEEAPTQARRRLMAKYKYGERAAKVREWLQAHPQGTHEQFEQQTGVVMTSSSFSSAREHMNQLPASAPKKPQAKRTPKKACPEPATATTAPPAQALVPQRQPDPPMPQGHESAPCPPVDVQAQREVSLVEALQEENVFLRWWLEGERSGYLDRLMKELQEEEQDTAQAAQRG